MEVQFYKNFEQELNSNKKQMKTFTISLISILISFYVSAQDITGKWNGVLHIQGTQLNLAFNILKTDTGFSSTMDSPDQGANGIPVTSTTFENNIIKFEIANLFITYNGELKGNEIIGIFKQGGLEFPMNLSKNEIEIIALKRPQEPTKPYPYHSEDITFKNSKANILLSGTLTLPKKEGVYPVVILISGSGPQNRDEELLGHKPFLVLADHLTKNGIGVLRYDDRGVGDSKGDFSSATSADFATDVESAIDFLKTRKDINKNKIGLVGHSEGGLIAPRVASTSKDVSFIVLLAGTGISGGEILLLQQKLIAKAYGVADADIKKSVQINEKIFELVFNSKNSEKLKIDLTNLLKERLKYDTSVEIPNGMTQEDYIATQVNQVVNPWMQHFITYNPALALEKVKCPVLAVNGEKDLQVPPKENLSAIKIALEKGKNEDVTIIEFPNLNHLFQECKTGSPQEYSTIEQTFSPAALKEITDWIKKQTK